MARVVVTIGSLWRRVARRPLARRTSSVCVASAAMTVHSEKTPTSSTALIRQVFDEALDDARLTAADVDGFIAVPSLSQLRFLEAHYQATALGLFESKYRHRAPLLCRTIDTCGAGPVTGLLEACRMIDVEGLDSVAIVAGDCVGGMSGTDFLALADRTAQGPDENTRLPSPAIVNGYEKYTAYELHTRQRINRDHLRLAVVLESFHASRQPESLFYKKRGSTPYSLEELRKASPVTPHISINECAWRSDGAACVILTKEQNLTAPDSPKIRLVGGAEGSGPLYPPDDITEDCFTSARVMRDAYVRSGLTNADIDFFALYDCFPICLVRAIEATGVCGSDVGIYLEAQYDRMLRGDTEDDGFFPINTHGGLLCFGAPFAVPAMFNVVESVRQLKRTARGRQLSKPRRALCYGNGGVLSSSAVVILERVG